jgi:hypothetical protein
MIDMMVLPLCIAALFCTAAFSMFRAYEEVT